VTVATIHQPGALAVAAPVQQDATVERLIRWAEGARAAESLAQALCRTAFCPKAFQGKPIDAAAAMLAGSEVGLSPLAALRAFDVIEGAAAPRAMTLRAIVQSRGHSIEVLESTPTRCRIRGRRAGEDAWQESTWTIQRAQQMKLTGKSNWQLQPTAMLLARATAEICRMIAADAILGIPYTAEELIDDASGDAPAAATRTVQRAAARPALSVAPPPAAAPPTGPPLPGEEEQPATEVEGITDPQLRKLGAVFGDLQITGTGSREARLRIASRLVGRELTSSKELSKTEATALIDTLVGDGPAIVAEVLGSADGAPPAAAPAGPPLPGEEADDYDPTAADDWAMDGAEAEGGEAQ
jgi:hypothetical protein